MNPSAPREPRKRRRWIRRIAFSMLGLLLLLSTAFVFRKALFSGLALSIIRSELSDQLGVSVHAQALEGDWWTDFELRGLSFRNARGLVRSCSDANLSLKLDPWKLSRGILGALRSLEVRAQELVLAVPSEPADEESQEGGPELMEIMATAWPLLPGGVTIEVENLLFGSRRGKASIEIETFDATDKSLGQRHIEIKGPDMAASLELEQPTVGLWTASAAGNLAGLGEFLRDLGTDFPILGGTVDFEVDLDTQGLAKGQLHVKGMRYDSKELEITVLDFEIRDHQLRIPNLRVEVPGLQILAKNLLLPRETRTNTLHAELWKGSLSIRIRNLEPYRSLLPEIIRTRLPIQGNLEGRLQAGELLLSKANLHGKGVSIRVDEGRIPVLGDYHRAHGELHGRIEVTEPIQLDIAPLGRLAAQGLFEGKCTGSLEQPVVEGRLDARAEADKATILVKGLARSANGKHSLEEMILSVTQAPEMRIAGQFALDSNSQKGNFTIKGTVDSETLEALRLLPALPRRIVCPDLSTNASFSYGENPSLDARLSMAQITSNGRSVGRLASRIEWSGREEIHISEFVVRPERQIQEAGQKEKEKGNVRLTAKGSIPLAEGATWDLSVEAENLALDFIGPFLSISLPRSRLDLTAKIQGPFESPSFSVDTGGFILQHAATLLVSLSDEQIRHLPQLPLRFRCKIEAGPDRIHVQRLHLTSGEGSEMLKFDAHGGLPFGTARMAKDLGVDPFQAEFHWNHDMALTASMKGSMHLEKDGLVLGPLDIKGPDGSAHGELRASFPVEDLLKGLVGRDSVKLTGKLDLQRIDVGKLPRAWMEDLDLTGIVDGELILGGSLADPEPRMRLDLEKVGLKVRGAPRIESLAGQIELHPQGLKILQLRGKIGIGDFTIKGGLKTQGTLWQDFDRADLRFELDGEDLMLVRSRGLRLLGNTHLLVTGTPEKIRVEGIVELESGKYNERQSLLMIDPSRRGGASIPGFVPFELEGELGKRTSFDVKLTTVNPFLIRTGLVEADVNAQLRLRGPGSKPYLVGAVTALKGWIRMPAAKLRIEQALVFFKKDRPLYPELDVTAIYRRKGHEIRMRIQGSYDKPSLLLSSSPHLEYDQILVFLSTGQLPRDLEGRAMDSMILAAGSYGANELWSWLIDTGGTEDAGESFFDRFSVESGQDFGTSGIESMRVEYKLTPQWFMQVERDADGFFNLGIVFRINF